MSSLAAALSLPFWCILAIAAAAAADRYRTRASRRAKRRQAARRGYLVPMTIDMGDQPMRILVHRGYRDHVPSPARGSRSCHAITSIARPR